MRQYEADKNGTGEATAFARHIFVTGNSVIPVLFSSGFLPLILYEPARGTALGDRIFL